MSGRAYRPQCGLALVAVLWVVAALSLIAAGVLQLVKGQVRAAHDYRQAVVAETVGDGAVNMALRAILEKRQDFARLRTLRFEVDEMPVEVEVVPISGLISLNGAPENQLQKLFVVAGGLDPARASLLAKTVVDWRTPGKITLSKGNEGPGDSGYIVRHDSFLAIEDLIQVPGVDYDLYGKIKDLVAVESSLGLVDPAAAPVAVLTVLAQGRSELAGAFAAQRDASAVKPVVDGRFAGEGVGGGGPQDVYRLDARVRFADQTVRLRRVVVSLSAALPTRYWRVLRTWPSWVVAPAPEQR